MPTVKSVPRAVRDDDDDEDQPVRSKGRRAKRSRKNAPASTGMKIAIIAGVLFLTTLCIGGVVWWAMPEEPKPAVIRIPPLGSRQNQQDNVEDIEIVEATGSEKFEIPDKALIQSDLYQSFVPGSNLPGLEKNLIKDGNESLTADVLNRVKQNTVYIETERDGGGGSGTGFFAFEKNLIVTNAHVIDMIDEAKPKPKSVRVYLHHGASNQKDYRVVEIVKVDRKHDLALLRISKEYKDEYPEGMQLASSLTTRETQKVFSLGFPYGNSAGKEVTVSPLSVTSHRYEDGRIKLVQFGGAALNPGNSGGPIVDAGGRVIGVAVSIFTGRSGDGLITNTGISFGVPADEASALYYGRPDRLELFPPLRKGDTLLLPLVFRLSEFSSRNAAPKMKVVTGDEKKPPENPSTGEEAPELKAGDSRHMYTGSLVLPELQDGKVYWLQPRLTLGENQTSWLEPLSYTPRTILDDKELPASAAGGAALGELKLKQRYQYVLNHATKGSYSLRLDYEGMTSGGTQTLKDLRVGGRIDDRPYPHKVLQRIWSNRVTEEDVSQSSSKLTSLLKANLNHWHDLAQLDVPKEPIAVGAVWKVPQRLVTLDFLFGFDAHQQTNLSCEYLGSFQEGARLIGVIRLQGTMADGSAPNTKYGKVSGLALIDGNSRQLLDLMLRGDVRKTTTGPNVLGGSARVDGVMQLRLQRPG
ncbi:MAG TPA: trypsin-like peptidase domain-containing protein [Gemmatales bacterium]|nr:trypsin-like peptidase domain-containing protein [Gemmatales bacterium]